MTNATVERLTELLDKKDAELEELRERLSTFEDPVTLEKMRWLFHRPMEADDVPDLPVPRLQIRFVPDPEFGWRRFQSLYELVYRPFEARVHGTTALMAVPLGMTTTNGGLGEVPTEAQQLLPIRDGTHIVSDAQHLRLPMFTVLHGKAEPVTPRDLNLKPGY